MKRITEDQSLRVWGIDPGKKGAIVCLLGGQVEMKLLMPMTSDNDYDLSALCEITNYIESTNAKVYLEEPGVIYGTSKTSMAKMFRGLGNIEAALTCNGVDYALVSPKEWQKEVWEKQDVVLKENSKRKDTKATSLKAANRLFTDVDWMYGDNEGRKHARTVPKDGLIDAALIAHYGDIVFRQGRLIDILITK